LDLLLGKMKDKTVAKGWEKRLIERAEGGVMGKVKDVATKLKEAVWGRIRDVF
jgi:hypothetical protein